MKREIVIFAGAGPGAIDLITMRCQKAITEADVIVYAGSLVNPDVLQFAKPSCVIHNSASMTLPEIMKILIDAASSGHKVLRLHTGDPSIYGAIAEQMQVLDKEGIAYEIIPGVSSAFAAAAAVKCELTVPGVAQSVIFARQSGRTPVPEGQNVTELASHLATMVLYLSADHIKRLVDDLCQGGYAQETPVAVVYKATWPDEVVLRGTLSDIAGKMSKAGIERQAIIIVGDVLNSKGCNTQLYSPTFSHGYRSVSGQQTTSSITLEAEKNKTSFAGAVAVYGLTEAGCSLACRIGEGLSATVYLSDRYAMNCPTANMRISRFAPEMLGSVIKENWRRFDGHIFVMATGIVVRKIAPLLADKTRDPAVVVCDEIGRFAISLLSGHIGGANRLASVTARILGGKAAITTATDVHGLVAFDEMAACHGWEIVNPEAIKALNSLLLQGRQIGMACPETVVRETYGKNQNIILINKGDAVPAAVEGVVVLGDRVVELPDGILLLRLRQRPVIVGVGCNRGTTAQEIEAAVSEVLKAHTISEELVRCVATIDIKQDEPGLCQFAEQRGWEIEFFDADTLRQVSTPTSSNVVEKATGTPSVSEAAALTCGRGRLIVPKLKSGNVTVAVATWEIKAGKLFAVGIGPGSPGSLTDRAKNVVMAADVIIGYKAYCSQIQWLIAGKRVISSGMGAEKERCNAAIDEALAGENVALISSGDAGIYGTAGLLMDILESRKIRDMDIEVVPGVTAASSAAAALGAPLMNDFAIVSLSDLMTSRDMIIRRLKAVADSGMTCVLYNPRSRKRHEVFESALDIFGKARGENTATGFVRHAGRNEEEKWTGKLCDLPVSRVDMWSVVIIGSADSEVVNSRLVEHRGYEVVVTP